MPVRFLSLYDGKIYLAHNGVLKEELVAFFSIWSVALKMRALFIFKLKIGSKVIEAGRLFTRRDGYLPTLPRASLIFFC